MLAGTKQAKLICLVWKTEAMTAQLLMLKFANCSTFSLFDKSNAQRRLEVEADIEVFELKKQIIDLQSILDAAPLHEEGEGQIISVPFLTFAF
jgi:hypothetical protein